MITKDLMPYKNLTDQYMLALDEEMRIVVEASSNNVKDLYGFLHYHLGWVDEHFYPSNSRKCKRLRSVLCMLVCEACGGDWLKAIPAAAAVELTHNFSLIHDDIEDGDSIRRNRPTLWILWGMPHALNAGDTLFTLARLALQRLDEKGISANAILNDVRIFDLACLKLTEGQFMDIDFEARGNVSIEEYLFMVEGKTATLMSLACELGSLVAGENPDRVFSVS